MPDDRLFHKRAGHGARVNQLSHLEYRVWSQYILSADDFGVMRQSAKPIQADNDALDEVPIRQIERALTKMVEIKMVLAFSHQGRPFICQKDWQTFQKIDYPRGTHNPKPPADILEQCDEPTRKLFDVHPGGKGRKKPEPVAIGSSSVPETSAEPSAEIRDYAGARPRETAQTKTNGSDERQTANGSRGALALGDHRRHVSCGRVCVPDFIHAEFRQRSPLPEDAADRELRAWYGRTLDAWDGRELGGEDAPAWWRARYREWKGVTAKKSDRELRAEAVRRELLGESA